MGVNGGMAGGGARRHGGLADHPPWVCDVDGAIAAGSHAAVTLVLFDATREVVMATGHQYLGIHEPFLVELLAVRDVFRWCSQMGFQDVVIQGDAKVFI
ncbi:unnamed protein product [Linum trigynum]|uniref:RNase H type-1 domain-containing protein n=1 Tax=Linum trigynum TaxID=586398 RepID=A0AAV2F893_9ROSI